MDEVLRLLIQKGVVETYSTLPLELHKDNKRFSKSTVSGSVTEMLLPTQLDLEQTFIKAP